jgi:type I restriction enzyme M protein
VLTPGRYVGAEATQEDTEPFEEKMQRLVIHLRKQTAQGQTLDDKIARILKELGYGS